MWAFVIRWWQVKRFAHKSRYLCIISTATKNKYDELCAKSAVDFPLTYCFIVGVVYIRSPASFASIVLDKTQTNICSFNWWRFSNEREEQLGAGAKIRVFVGIFCSLTILSMLHSKMIQLCHFLIELFEKWCPTIDCLCLLIEDLISINAENCSICKW